jgi:hypothetical protein
LIKSNQKSSQQKCFFAALPVFMPIAEAFALQIVQNHGLQLFCPASPLFPPLLQKLAMPFATAQATIVLPAFARNLSADGDRK